MCVCVCYYSCYDGSRKDGCIKSNSNSTEGRLALALDHGAVNAGGVLQRALVTPHGRQRPFTLKWWRSRSAGFLQILLCRALLTSAVLQTVHAFVKLVKQTPMKPSYENATLRETVDRPGRRSHQVSAVKGCRTSFIKS